MQPVLPRGPFVFALCLPWIQRAIPSVSVLGSMLHTWAAGSLADLFLICRAVLSPFPSFSIRAEMSIRALASLGRRLGLVCVFAPASDHRLFNRPDAVGSTLGALGMPYPERSVLSGTATPRRIEETFSDEASHSYISEFAAPTTGSTDYTPQPAFSTEPSIPTAADDPAVDIELVRLPLLTDSRASDAPPTTAAARHVDIQKEAGSESDPADIHAGSASSLFEGMDTGIGYP